MLQDRPYFSFGFTREILLMNDIRTLPSRFYLFCPVNPAQGAQLLVIEV